MIDVVIRLCNSGPSRAEKVRVVNAALIVLEVITHVETYDSWLACN
jgi:hypothetical protein